MEIILKPSQFYLPIDYPRNSFNRTAEDGDFIIDIPTLNFNEEQYANYRVVGRTLHNDEGLHFGHVELVGLKCICKAGKPLYYGLPTPKKYEYTLSLYLYDNNKNWMTHELNGTDLTFLFRIIIPLINLALKDSCLLSQLDLEWLQWQCNVWNFGEASGQGRGFTFYDYDIYGLESLYKYIKSFNINGISRSVYKRGGGYYWTDIYIKYRYIDNYISNLISKALNTKFTFTTEERDEICFKVEVDNESRDGYCPGTDSILSEEKSEKYREQFEMRIMIYMLRNFDLTELKKNRLIKS